MSQPARIQDSAAALTAADGEEQIVTFSVADQMFGVSALKVRDVLRPQPLTRVPQAPAAIVGAINLRGHIVTAISMHVRLECPPPAVDARHMCVVVEHKSEAFCLLVDAVGDVITIPTSDVVQNPGAMPPTWAQVSRGVYRMKSELLIILDVQQLLALR